MKTIAFSSRSALAFKLVVVSLLLCLVPQIRGAAVIWNGPATTNTANNWSDVANWLSGAEPTSADDAKFFDTGAIPGVSNVNNTVDGSTNIASLQFGNTNSTHTTLIAAGQALTISGAGGLVVGTPADVAAVKNLTNTITGAGGSLVINNSSASLALNQGTATSVTGARANLDLSGLDNFTMNGFRIGLGTTSLPNPGNANQREAGMLVLAKTNVIILNLADTLANYQLANKTNALELSRNPGNNAGIISLLLLGNSNYFALDSLGIGRDKASGSAAGWVGFNPAVTNSNPTALFRNIDGSSRVTWWSIGDMNANASSAQVSVGTNDFSNGFVDAKINVLSLARDCSPAHSATATIFGVLTFNNGVIDANTIYNGNQSLGPSSGSTAAQVGIINVVGPSATLIVNNNLVLGNTTQGVLSIEATRTSGILNIRNGTVLANQISVGAVSTNNVIAITNGTLVVSNAIASPAVSLTTLNMTNSTLQLSVTGVTNVCVTNLVAGGATNIINPASITVFSSYPRQIALIKYQGAAIGGVGYNFGFGANTLPPTAPGAYLSNNVANKSIDLVLPYDPRPVITTEPGSYSGSPGDNVTFTAVISPFSVLPLSYQWYLGSTPLSDGPTGNGSTLSGALTSSLTITSAQPGDNGNYIVVVSNVYGSATSAPPANLTISAGCVPPSISGGPNSITVIQGSNAVFTATVAGSPLPTLQWQRNGVDISGETTLTYSLANVQYPADDQAVFSLVASNSCGVVTNSATLTVIVPPTISVQPTNLVVVSSQPACFYVVASGVPSPSYQWLKNGSPISGATASSLCFPNTIPTNAAVYSVQVANAAGSLVSASATLLVNSTMAVTSLSPASGGTGICPDTILRVTFDSAPVLGNAGKIRIFNATNSATPVDTLDLSQSAGNGTQPRSIAGASYNAYPVIISGNTATIFPHLGVLATNQTYYVTIETVLGGVFKDGTGATFAGISDTNAWRFTTKPTGPANPTNVVVAADGSGDFVTVQGAMDFVPAANTTPRLINVRNGTYQEIVFINAKNNLTLLGQSRDQTIISYANNDALNAGTSLRPCFRANGNDNTLANLTLTNATPKGGTQAEALRTDGKRIIVLNCKLASFQDTMLNNNVGDLVYIQDSLIQGDTDFIWGGSTTFLTNCEIRTLSSGTQITQARTAAITNGFSFVKCQLTRPSGAVTNCGLGRDLGFTDNNVAFIYCLVDSHITGWQNADARDWEFGNSNITATAAVTYNGVQLAPTDPNLTNAETANLWLYGWQPQAGPFIIGQPVDQNVAGGASASFTVSAIGVANPAYQWLRNGTNVPGATSATLNIAAAHAGDAGQYAVVASNAGGSITSSVVNLTVGNTAPLLTPISDSTINVGVALSLPNVATDPDVPPQSLTFTLLAGPTNAAVDGSTGVFTWRPLVTQANSVNPIAVVVMDNGSPALSATNNFTVTVNPLNRPNVTSVSSSGGQFTLTVSADVGPDYAVQYSTNLTDWQTLFITNSPPSPFSYTDSSSDPIRFYRLKAGPPLP